MYTLSPKAQLAQGGDSPWRAAVVVTLVMAAVAMFVPFPLERDGAADASRLVAIRNGTPNERAIAHWAVGRFGAAGLALPAVEISFHDDVEACGGFIGRYRRSEQRVLICNRGGRTTEVRHTLLHELAHAWSFASLEGAVIDRFIRMRGVANWQDAEGAWWQQGVEQAAEIISWGVQDPDDLFRSVWTLTELCDELAGAYELLTELSPLNTSTRYCRSERAYLRQ